VLIVGGFGLLIYTWIAGFNAYMETYDHPGPGVSVKALVLGFFTPATGWALPFVGRGMVFGFEVHSFVWWWLLGGTAVGWSIGAMLMKDKPLG
jgi:hypothetical protein